MKNLIFPLVISIAISLLLGHPVATVATRFGLMDMPGSAPHKKHARPTPLAGGVLIVAAFLILVFTYRNDINRELLVVFAGALIIFVFGLWDDLKGLRVIHKLIGQLIATSLLVACGVQVYFMTVLFQDSSVVSPLIAQILNVLITFFWVVGITNAMNMIDSMDGIVAGLGVIAAAFFMGATGFSQQHTLAIWSACLLGISLGLYIWNGIAVRFFLGDSGAQTLGFLLASFGILYNPLNRNPESSWIVPILLLGIPIFDTSLVVLSRLRRKQPVGSGRRYHTYHRFIRLGLRPRIAVLCVHFMALTIGSLAFYTFYLPSWMALLFFMIALLIGLGFLLWLERQPTLDDE